MSNDRDARFWLNAWSPVALAVVLVSISSTSYFGSDRMNGPLRAIWQTLFGPVSPAHWYWFVFAFRKSCHFIGYGVIGLAWLRAWRLTFPGFGFFSEAGLALLGTALLASCDEFHQRFIPNRTGSPWDVLLDCFGAMTICLLAYAVSRGSRRKRAERSAVHSSS